MKRTIKITIIIATVLLLPKAVLAQFNMSGEVRPRTEFGHGYKTLPDSAQKVGLYTGQRSRLNFDYETESYKMKIVLQDVRVWGNQSQLVGNEDFGSSIHEAWGETFLSDKLSMKFGRQEIVYDDHRIFGTVGWAQQARSHDALLFKYKVDSSFIIHVGGAFNQDGANYTSTIYRVPKSYKAMQYVWAHKHFSKNTMASFLFLNNGKQPIKYDFDPITGSVTNALFKDNYSQTIGGRFVGANFAGVEGLGLNANVYSQMGIEGNWANDKISALNLCVDVSYKLTDQLTATVGYEHLSGNDQTDTTSAYNKVNHAFNPFYGTNHKFNGLMDNFYVGNWAGSVGLNDIYLKLKYKKAKKFWIGADVHLFSSAGEVLDVVETSKTGNITAMSSGLGTEIDLTAGWKLAKDVDFKMGYSHMLGSATLGMLQGVTTTNSAGETVGRTDQTSNWAWMMVTIKPKFISNK